MATDNGGASRDQALERELAALKHEYESLKEVKVRAEQDLANLRARLAELEAKAQAEYGTADPEALARLLAERRAANEAAVADYRAHIQEIRQKLAQAEAANGSGAESA